VTRIFSFFLLTAVLLTACVGTEQRADPRPGIQWRGLADGRAEAAESGKPMIVDFFFGEDCHRCAMLEKQVYGSGEVCEKIIEHFVPIRIDLTRELTADEQKLADEFKSGGECMLLFLDAKGEVISNKDGVNLCFMGMVTQQQFLAYLDDVLRSGGNTP